MRPTSRTAFAAGEMRVPAQQSEARRWVFFRLNAAKAGAVASAQPTDAAPELVYRVFYANDDLVQNIGSHLTRPDDVEVLERVAQRPVAGLWSGLFGGTLHQLMLPELDRLEPLRHQFGQDAERPNWRNRRLLVAGLPVELLADTGDARLYFLRNALAQEPFDQLLVSQQVAVEARARSLIFLREFAELVLGARREVRAKLTSNVESLDLPALLDPLEQLSKRYRTRLLSEGELSRTYGPFFLQVQAGPAPGGGQMRPFARNLSRSMDELLVLAYDGQNAHQLAGGHVFRRYEPASS